MATDRTGAVYVSDYGNRSIWSVGRSSGPSRVASGGLGGLGCLACDGTGGILVAVDCDRVCRIDPRGHVSRVAGAGVQGFSGDGGPALKAQVWFPEGMATDFGGAVYIADGRNSRIRRVDAAGIISTVAGCGRLGYGGDGGPAVSATLNWPSSIALGSDGSMYIADTRNSRIRRIDRKGMITTVAGTGRAGFSGDGGPATEAALYYPSAVAVGPDHTLYIADALNYRVRRIDARGIITTVAGTGRHRYGANARPALQLPRGIAVTNAGEVYLCEDPPPGRISRIDRTGAIQTVMQGCRFRKR